LTSGTYRETGHIEIDFGLDSLFLQRKFEFTKKRRSRFAKMWAKLVEFTKKTEANTRATSRRLWSESEESPLPQEVIPRLQKVQ